MDLPRGGWLEITRTDKLVFVIYVPEKGSRNAHRHRRMRPEVTSGPACSQFESLLECLADLPQCCSVFIRARDGYAGYLGVKVPGVWCPGRVTKDHVIVVV